MNIGDVVIPMQQLGVGSHSVPDICIFYNKAGCKEGDDCPCFHVCGHFINADCKFGEKCKREHSFSSFHNRRVLKKRGMDSINDLKVYEYLQARERQRTVSVSSVSEKHVMPVNLNTVPSSQDDKVKDTEICGFNLRGKCNYDNTCIHQHTELPYLWEVSVEGDDKWESFSSDQNMTIEHAYCDANNDSSSPLMVKGLLYRVNFQDMTAIAVLPQAGMCLKLVRNLFYKSNLGVVNGPFKDVSHRILVQFHKVCQDAF